MSDQGSFYQRDRAWHPPPLTPGYKTSVLRSPQQAADLAREHAFRDDGPGVRSSLIGPLDNDLIRNCAKTGDPIGPRMIVHGRVVDENGARRPWRAHRNLAGQRRRPLSAQEGGLSRAARSQFRRLQGARSPTTEGRFMSSHRQARALSLAQPRQRLATGAHPFLDFRPRFRPAADHRRCISRAIR